MGSTEALAKADWLSIAQVTITAAAGIFALAVGFQGWLLVRATILERVLLIVAGFALVYPGPISNTIGFVLVLVALARSEEHTSELQSLMRHSFADFCLKTKKNTKMK